MARYIDADALLKGLELSIKSWSGDCNSNAPTMVRAYQDVVYRVKNAPTADVVPRAEVDELICKLECFLCHATGGRLSKHTYDLGTMETVATDCINETYNDGYGEGCKDCAREIFEEIEKCMMHDIIPTIGVYKGSLELRIAELKKKYTWED